MSKKVENPNLPPHETLESPLFLKLRRSATAPLAHQALRSPKKTLLIARRVGFGASGLVKKSARFCSVRT